MQRNTVTWFGIIRIVRVPPLHLWRAGRDVWGPVDTQARKMLQSRSCDDPHSSSHGQNITWHRLLHMVLLTEPLQFTTGGNLSYSLILIPTVVFLRSHCLRNFWSGIRHCRTDTAHCPHWPSWHKLSVSHLFTDCPQFPKKPQLDREFCGAMPTTCSVVTVSM